MLVALSACGPPNALERRRANCLARSLAGARPAHFRRAAQRVAGVKAGRVAAGSSLCNKCCLRRTVAAVAAAAAAAAAKPCCLSQSSVASASKQTTLFLCTMFAFVCRRQWEHNGPPLALALASRWLPARSSLQLDLSRRPIGPPLRPSILRLIARSQRRRLVLTWARARTRNAPLGRRRAVSRSGRSAAPADGHDYEL